MISRASIAASGVEAYPSRGDRGELDHVGSGPPKSGAKSTKCHQVRALNAHARAGCNRLPLGKLPHKSASMKPILPPPPRYTDADMQHGREKPGGARQEWVALCRSFASLSTFVCPCWWKEGTGKELEGAAPTESAVAECVPLVAQSVDSLWPKLLLLLLPVLLLMTLLRRLLLLLLFMLLLLLQFMLLLLLLVQLLVAVLVTMLVTMLVAMLVTMLVHLLLFSVGATHDAGMCKWSWWMSCSAMLLRAPMPVAGAAILPHSSVPAASWMPEVPKHTARGRDLRHKRVRALARVALMRGAREQSALGSHRGGKDAVRRLHTSSWRLLVRFPSSRGRIETPTRATTRLPSSAVSPRSLRCSRRATSDPASMLLRD